MGNDIIGESSGLGGEELAFLGRRSVPSVGRCIKTIDDMSRRSPNLMVIELLLSVTILTDKTVDPFKHFEATPGGHGEHIQGVAC